MISVVVLAGCSDGLDAELDPFRAPRWTVTPADLEIVDAVVGTVGTAAARREAEAAARDLVLPRLYAEAGARPEVLVREIDEDRRTYELVLRIEEVPSTLGRFMVLVLNLEVAHLVSRGIELAMARLHAELFPGEAMPASWTVQPRSVDQVMQAVVEIEDRVAQLRERYEERLGPFTSTTREPGHLTWGHLEDLQMVLHVARTGDHRVVPPSIHAVLERRGFSSTPMPGELR
ncbi:MAG: hypothetical protein KF773_20960 [Deltaproteobacteria bacterium]|nr:hypothetical protein [Deltaproteobacteria bacterium]